MGNLFWGMRFAPFSHKTALNRRSSLISLVSRKNGAKPHRHYFDCDSLHESATNQAQSCNDESMHDSAMPNLAMTDKGDDDIFLDSTPQKICKKEYFLQIKDKYEFGDGFVIYVVFGAYYAPNSAYIIVRKNSKYCEILGDIIPTKANLSALNELQFLGVMLDN